MSDTVESLFEPDGDTFVPTTATPGPWGDDLMHGGALGALCVHVLERAGADDVVAVRFSADFVRPLLRKPLTIETSVARSGKRFELVEGVVRAEGIEIARCSLAAIRPVAVELPPGAGAVAARPPADAPDDYGRPEVADERVYFFGTGIDMRAPGGFQGSHAWLRLLLPVVPGVEPSPMSRTVAAADFGLGISSHGEWPPRIAYPNADLVVHTVRPAEGESVRIEASSVWNENGIGLCTMTLADPRGTIGAAEQSQVLAPTS